MSGVWRTIAPCCRRNVRPSPRILPRRRFAEEPRQNSRAQQSAKRAFMKAHLSAYVTGVGILLYARYYYKRKAGRSDSGDVDVERYRDPLMGKDTAMVKYGGFWLPQYIYDSSTSGFNQIETFEIRDNDIIVASFPKSGTTWVQEIVSLVTEDTPAAGGPQANMEERFPYLEYVYPGLKDLARRPGPRLIKTHLPYTLLPHSVRRGKGKVIYIARNPKDVSVSYYHFVKMFTISDYKGCFDEFFQSFISGKVNYGPWCGHVLAFWRRRQDDNVLFITYEDLHKFPERTTRQVASFLARDLDDEQIKTLVRRTSFDAMKQNPAANYSWWDEMGIRNRERTPFMRKGKVGDWKILYDDAMVETVDVMCTRELSPDGLEFTDS